MSMIPNQHWGVVSQDEMARISAEARHRGETVVFTNGCFDILHMGHVSYLQQARYQGNILLVGVNSDLSVQKLKGSGRPFNGAKDRAGVVAALASVSAVSIFDDDTAISILEQVRPDVYVKGGDYSADPAVSTYPVEARTISMYGGRLQIIPFETGYSTTALIKRIQNSKS